MKKEHTKMDKAIHQLNVAINLFLENKDYFSAITLAGASEEVLGNFIERNGDKATHAQNKFNLSKEYGLNEKEINDGYTNKIRNWLKHAKNKDEDTIVADEEIEAIQYIIRGISNFLMLKGYLEQSHITFLTFIREKNKDLFMDIQKTDYDKFKAIP